MSSVQFLIILGCILFTCILHVDAGLFDRLIYMMMRNRRRHYVSLPVSRDSSSYLSSIPPLNPLAISSYLTTLSNYLYPYYGSALTFPYNIPNYYTLPGYNPITLNSLSSIALPTTLPHGYNTLTGYTGLGPIGPFGGINPFFNYLNLADLFASLNNHYHNNQQNAQANNSNSSDPREEKKLASRIAGLPPYTLPTNRGSRYISGTKLYQNLLNSKTYRPPFIFPEHEEFMDALR